MLIEGGEGAAEGSVGDDQFGIEAEGGAVVGEGGGGAIDFLDGIAEFVVEAGVAGAEGEGALEGEAGFRVAGGGPETAGDFALEAVEFRGGTEGGEAGEGLFSGGFVACRGMGHAEAIPGAGVGGLAPGEGEPEAGGLGVVATGGFGFGAGLEVFRAIGEGFGAFEVIEGRTTLFELEQAGGGDEVGGGVGGLELEEGLEGGEGALVVVGRVEGQAEIEAEQGLVWV